MGEASTSDQATRATTPEITAVAEWKSPLTALAAGYLLFETLSGLIVWLFPFSVLVQLSVLLHTAIGILFLAPVLWYLIRHWWVRRKVNLSHYQLLGYIATTILGACLVSGAVVTWQGVVGPRLTALWDVMHLVTGLGLVVFVVVHVLTVALRKTNNAEVRHQLSTARQAIYVKSLAGGIVLALPIVAWATVYQEPDGNHSFPDDYNWKFGEDRPFAPSMARIEASWADELQKQIADTVGNEHRDVVLTSLSKGVESRSTGESQGVFDQIRSCTSGLPLSDDQKSRIEAIMADAATQVKRGGALHAQDLAGSASCGTSSCHSQIYEEWLPSAHRYSSMDAMFQRTQELMSEETSPEHTRYCAGCHDPISLFSGAKNSGNITLSSLGADEGISCLVCHCVVQSDVQGNGD